jgi:hypothetical protein
MLSDDVKRSFKSTFKLKRLIDKMPDGLKWQSWSECELKETFWTHAHPGPQLVLAPARIMLSDLGAGARCRYHLGRRALRAPENERADVLTGEAAEKTGPTTAMSIAQDLGMLQESQGSLAQQPRPSWDRGDSTATTKEVLFG